MPRTIVATLGLSLLISAAAVAQAPEKLVVTPAAPLRPNLDFGLDQALKRLPEGPWRVVKPTAKHTLPMQPTLLFEAAPLDCAMVKKHTHGPMSLRTIAPPVLPKHQLKTVPVAPCPVR